jgi:hypothetical protein
MKNPDKKKRLVEVADHVLALLVKDERTRDDDQLLCCMVWSQICAKKGVDVRTQTAYDFLISYYRNELPLADTITRARRKIQEEHPLMRGKKYNERQNKQEQFVAQLRELE